MDSSMDMVYSGSNVCDSDVVYNVGYICDGDLVDSGDCDDD